LNPAKFRGAYWSTYSNDPGGAAAVPFSVLLRGDEFDVDDDEGREGKFIAREPLLLRFTSDEPNAGELTLVDCSRGEVGERKLLTTDTNDPDSTREVPNTWGSMFLTASYISILSRTLSETSISDSTDGITVIA
jgi:hypothetical protein